MPKIDDTEIILTRLLAALSEKYNDVCSPGVIVSQVRQGEYYAAIHRFPHGPDRREVLQKAYAETPNLAIWHVANNWLNSIKPPDSELKRLRALLEK